MGARRLVSSSLWRVARAMLDRRRLRFWILLVVALMVCLHAQLGYPSAWRHLVPPDPEERAALRRSDVVVVAVGGYRAESRDTWEQRAMERVVLESRPRVARTQNSSSSSLSTQPTPGGSIMLPNHTVVPLEPGYVFDPEHGRDVIVFLHIQKTGGTTFGRHLVSNLDLRTPCRCVPDRKKCDCGNAEDKIWTVNRYSTGWRCGLHADWTELTQCVDKMLDKVEGARRDRRYLYITILRDPFTRYISEFKHVQRGATWKAARLQCDGRQASLEEVPFCFDGSDWSGVSLDAFMKCPHNLANNRQVRMLANLTLSGCYKNGAISPELRHDIMLKSAKENVARMAFFGLTEYQQETQYLFERTFGLRFRRDFVQYNRTHAGEVGITHRQRRQILKLNQLDVDLYKFAKDLFFQRLRRTLRDDARRRISAIVDGYESSPVADRDVRRGGTPADEDQRNGYRADYLLRRDEYEEGDEDDAEDDDEYNHRIARKRKDAA